MLKQLFNAVCEPPSERYCFQFVWDGNGPTCLGLLHIGFIETGDVYRVFDRIENIFQFVYFIHFHS